jgi:predicted O-methyltransferase YrrM
MNRTFKTILLVLLAVITLTAIWGYNNFDEKATEGWSRTVRTWWYEYQDSREERIVLAPDNVEIEADHSDDVTLTEDWFTTKSPAWVVALEPFKGKPNLNYLEVGAYEGRSVMWMFDNILTDPSSKATIIDIFYDMGVKGYSADLRARYDANIERVGGTDRTTTIVGFSQIKLRDLPLNTYDIIYIDGSHFAPSVLEDAVLAQRLLKEDGVLIFDDYRWWIGASRLKRPKLAIDTFIDFYGDQFTVLHNTKQVILKKTSLDAKDQGMVIAEE